MALSDKFTTIESLLTSHFRALNQGERKEEIATILTKLKEMGGTTEAGLLELNAEDFESLGVPRLVARRIVKAIGAVQDVQKQVVIVDDNPVNLAARLKPEELVEQYDPMDPTSPYGVRLKAISNGVKFFVYTADGAVNVSLSQKFLREILDGYSPRKTAMVDGRPGELFAVGERPARYADQNPAVPDQMLRPDGLSDAHVDWGSISLPVKQLIYIAVKECAVNMSEIDLFDLVNGKSFDDVARRFADATIKFNKLKGTDSLPSLKVELTPKVVATK